MYSSSSLPGSEHCHRVSTPDGPFKSLKNGDCGSASAHYSMQPECSSKQQARGSASDRACPQANGRHENTSNSSVGLLRGTEDIQQPLGDETAHLIPISDGACIVTEYDNDSARPDWHGRVISDLPASFTNGSQEQASDTGALLSRGSKYSKQQLGRLPWGIAGVRYHLQRGLQLEGVRR